jgi:hypothetical protein
VRKLGAVAWLCLAACGAGTPEPVPPPSVVLVPPPATVPLDGVALPKPSRVDGPEPDPLLYYVGWWDGTINESLRTLLYVDRDGRFEVQYVPRPGEDACRMAGRWLVAADIIELQVEFNSCNPATGEAVLERPILSQSDDEFTVRSPDATFRYTRRPER